VALKIDGRFDGDMLSGVFCVRVCLYGWWVSGCRFVDDQVDKLEVERNWLDISFNNVDSQSVSRSACLCVLLVLSSCFKASSNPNLPSKKGTVITPGSS